MGHTQTLTTTTTTPGTSLAGLSQEALDFAKAGKSENTQRAYKAAWRSFMDFCDARDVAFLPASPTTVTDFLITLKGLKVSTIQVKLSAIGFAHGLAHEVDPTKDATVRQVFAGMRRKLGKPVHKKAAIEFDELEAMIRALPSDTIAGVRDRAVLLVGFAGAFRRSELADLDVEDLRFTRSGLTITIRHSKTDQESQGKHKTIPSLESALCPITAVRAWLKASGVRSGPLFRSVDRWGHVRNSRLSDKSVTLIVKTAAEGAGLDPAQFAGHSLRSGFITTAAKAGVHEWQIQEQTGHKSTAVLRGYIQSAGRGAAAAVRGAFGE